MGEHRVDSIPLGARVVVSRALPPGLRSRLAGRTLIEAPVVGGVTVWAAARTPPVSADVALVVQPNWYGCGEPQAVVDAIECDVVVVADPFRDHANANYLAKRIGLLPRTRLAHGSPTCAVFVAMLPHDPVAVLPVNAPEGLDVTIIEDRPELPGGVRFDVDPIASEDHLSRYASSLEAALRSRRAR